MKLKEKIQKICSFNKDHINFNEKEHKYYLLDPKPYEYSAEWKQIDISVSGFIKVLQSQKDRDFLTAKWAQPILLKASTRGTIVHKWSENYDKDQTIPSIPLFASYCNYYKKWYYQTMGIEKKEIIATELILYSKSLKIAGTIDRLIYDPETKEVILVDLKTSAEVNKDTYWHQQLTYAYILSEWGIKVDKICLLALKSELILKNKDKQCWYFDEKQSDKKDEIKVDIKRIIKKRIRKVK